MTRTLPALHDGHAPFHLHQAFADALDAFEDWLPGHPEPRISVEQTEVPISAIFGRMRSCEDLLPQRVVDAIASVLPNSDLTPSNGEHLTFAEAASVLRAKCVERFKKVAAAFDDDAVEVPLRRVLL